MATSRTEETTGRLEVTLAGQVSRIGWLAVHVAVMVLGLVVVTLSGALALGAATALSTGRAAQFGTLLGAGTVYLPGVMVLFAVALAVFAAVPRLFAVALVFGGFAVFARRDVPYG